MAESSIFWPTNGTGDGATNYTSDDLQALFRRMFNIDTTADGVIANYANDLAVTADGVGSTTPVLVATGAAFVYGIPYENTVSVNVTIPTPSASPRYDYIVLRADYSAQTVRIVKIAGTEGGGIPALTQSAGVVWDVPLATLYTTIGGVITVTDARRYCRVGSKLVYARFGQSATNWADANSVLLSSAQEVIKPGMQVGAGSFLMPAAATGIITLTFPVAFASEPLVIPIVADTTPVGSPIVLRVPLASVTSTTANIEWETADASSVSYIAFNWIAIGQMS